MVATDAGIAAVVQASDRAAIRGLERRPGDPLVEGPPHTSASRRRHLAAARAWLDELFDGRPPGVGPALDTRDLPGWDRRVLEAVRAIPWGSTATYGEIARRVGSPRASRAVGGAVGRNRFWLLVPCHRVVAADGLGGYGGGLWSLELKRQLLEREGVDVARLLRTP
ncbi:MAG TPA: methylated-DNA--[protein]-cysteine S-methyltransferase [Candidatus Limnocylindrales bacterium]|nr:methylated-DNA--[protein]-cysteine S-methyltransferase [Candidatus Limnocylindrales bacterium]